MPEPECMSRLHRSLCTGGWSASEATKDEFLEVRTVHEGSIPDLRAFASCYRRHKISTGRPVRRRLHRAGSCSSSGLYAGQTVRQYKEADRRPQVLAGVALSKPYSYSSSTIGIMFLSGGARAGQR